MKIYYGVCSWGLGHATRSLPVVRALVKEGHEVVMVSTGRALELLKKELRDSVEYMDYPDYPLPYSENPKGYLPKFFAMMPIYLHTLIWEHENFYRYIEKMNKKPDIIISDARYGIWHKKIPSYFITHQLRLINPGRVRTLEYLTEYWNLYFARQFYGVIVPDFKENDLTGELSHNLSLIDENKVRYVGPISDFKKKEVSEDIDLLVSISGPEPQRTVFENIMVEQLRKLRSGGKFEGNIIVTEGKTEQEVKREDEDGIKFISFVNKKEREELLNRAKMVISRSGYSTIMDLCILGKKALFVPTPQQTEQEYLSEYHNAKKTFFSVPQSKISLFENLEEAKRYKGRNGGNVEKTVKEIVQIVCSKENFGF